jgi:hypothetical protein
MGRMIFAFVVVLAVFYAYTARAENVIYGTTPTGPQPFVSNTCGQFTQTLQTHEDETNSVGRFEQQFSFAVDDADLVVKAAPGFLHSVWCYPEDEAATAGTVRITNTTAAGGAETTEVWGEDFAAAAYRPVTAVLDIVMTTGIVIDFTDTADVKCGVSYR